MVGLLWIKYFCSSYLGLSILCLAQLHVSHNRSRISSTSNYSSSLPDLQSVVDYGTLAHSLSNLGGDRSKFGLGLLN